MSVPSDLQKQVGKTKLKEALRTDTVEEAGKHWLSDCEQVGLERSTRDSYQSHLDLHITLVIGHLLLTKLNIPSIRAWQDSLVKEGRFADLIKRVVIDLGAILAVAQDHGYVARNVGYEMNSRLKSKMKRVEKHRKRKLGHGADIPTHEEIRAILDQAPVRHRPLMITLVFTGLRSSELRGLPWTSINFDQHQIVLTGCGQIRYHRVGQDIGRPKDDPCSSHCHQHTEGMEAFVPEG